MSTPVETVALVMDAFAERTGLTSAAPPRRYLWTDAFAVCNCLALHRATGSGAWLQRAGALIEQVHHVLGRHRPDDARTGWISGLPEAECERHPTAGGLRIGKPLPERGPGEPVDPQLDWERDGQYYHYLTRWLHALVRTAKVTGDPELIRYAAELARAAHRAFRHSGPAGPALYWKMSIDLSRPVVTSTGEHDALDGLVTAAAVQAATPTAGAPTAKCPSGAGPVPTAGRHAAAVQAAAPTAGTPTAKCPSGAGSVATDGTPAAAAPAADGSMPTAGRHAAPAAHDPVAVDLAPALQDLAQLCAGRGWASNDALGIGSLLTSALELARLVPRVPAASSQLLTRVLRDAARSLDLVTVGDLLTGPAYSRLAFRELGLGIGLAALERLDQLRQTETLPGGAETGMHIERMLRHLPLRTAITSFWLQRSHQAVPGWTEHEDINAVMLATCLLPDGYLG
jgi:hypothetical protein